MKRAVDIVLATAGLILFAPVFAVIAALIVLESGRPVFFRVERIGYKGRPLRMLKFRKMRSGARGKALTMDGDDRLTRVGKWLMRHRLDELPQLWHVLRGEMSLVGPRPEHLGFVARHTTAYSQILQVRPGVTGWSQLAFADEGAILDPNDPVGHYVEAILPRKVALDYCYASERNMRQDLGILFATFVTVVLRRPVMLSPSTGRLTFGARARMLAQGITPPPPLSRDPTVAAEAEGVFKA